MHNYVANALSNDFMSNSNLFNCPQLFVLPLKFIFLLFKTNSQYARSIFNNVQWRVMKRVSVVNSPRKRFKNVERKVIDFFEKQKNPSPRWLSSFRLNANWSIGRVWGFSILVFLDGFEFQRLLPLANTVDEISSSRSEWDSTVSEGWKMGKWNVGNVLFSTIERWLINATGLALLSKFNAISVRKVRERMGKNLKS